jgi:catechol 2,3-dioxygenase-like lactoylglutathione lyase family enzyme
VSPPLGLGFLKFTVADLEAMEAFYQQALGMTVQKRLEFPEFTEVILSSGGADLALVRYKDGREVALGTANGPIGVYLKDVDGAYDRAIAAGGEARQPPASMGGIRVAFVADPEGHEIEFLRLDDQ